VLDHTGGVDEIIPPVLISIGIAVPGSDQLRIGKEIIIVDIDGSDMVGIRINLYEILFTAAETSDRDGCKYGYKKFISHINDVDLLIKLEFQIYIHTHAANSRESG
jgi:hypothetical protein